MVSPLGALLNSVVAGLTGADTDGLLDCRNENLAVADFIGFSCGTDGLDRAVEHFVGQNDLNFNFWQEVDDIFSAAVKLRVPFLTPKSLNLHNREALHADILKRFFNLIEFEGLNNGFDLFHGDTRCFDCSSGISLFFWPGNCSMLR